MVLCYMFGLYNSAKRCFGITSHWYQPGNSDAIKSGAGIAHDKWPDPFNDGLIKRSSVRYGSSLMKASGSRLSMHSSHATIRPSIAPLRIFVAVKTSTGLQAHTSNRRDRFQQAELEVLYSVVRTFRLPGAWRPRRLVLPSPAWRCLTGMDLEG